MFIIATIAALAAAAVQPVHPGTDNLTGVADQPNRLAGAALLYLIAAGTSVGMIAVMKRANENDLSRLAELLES